MDKRFQVFVSSTYKDLIPERVEVIQALLELDCIPSGMEYFPAADETQWDFIKKLIDESDYYIVIIAGKYGSVDRNGISYTQKEYEYAISKKIPTIAFLHSDIDSLASSKTEKDKETIDKLDAFKELVKRKLCKFWKTPHELGAVVSRSISQAKKNYPRTGWIRADSISETSEKDIVQLYKKIDELETKLKESSQFSDLTKNFMENLADDEDKIKFHIDVKFGPSRVPLLKRINVNVSWNEINYQLLPKLLLPIKLPAFKVALNSMAKEIYLNSNLGLKLNEVRSVTVTPDFLETVKIQLLLLERIKIYKEEVIIEGTSKYVNMIELTPKGKEKLLSLRAIMKLKA